MRLYIVFIFITFLWDVEISNETQTKIFYVSDFGAKPNDGKDDSKEFQACFNEAIKYPTSIIIVNSGTYNISKQLTIDYTTQSIEIRGEIIKNSLPIINSTSDSNIMRIRGFFSSPSVGKFSLANLRIIGNNIPFSSKHPKAGNRKWNAVVSITDLKEASITNLQIENFYGEGIYISSTDQLNKEMNTRFTYVEIINCKIIDVWGSNPKLDDYGDAIYLSNISKGLIKNNYIENSLLRSKQLGRSGIVLEYFCENIELFNNQIIEGYDRALHIENTRGGHIIKENVFQGSDLGIVIAEDIKTNYLPMIFSENIITNKKLHKNIGYKKSYNEGSFGDRSLVYLITKGERDEKLIFFNNNKFSINNKYEYNSNSVFNIRSKNVELFENSFISTDMNLKFSIFNYGKSSLKNNNLAPNFNIK